MCWSGVWCGSVAPFPDVIEAFFGSGVGLVAPFSEGFLGSDMGEIGFFGLPQIQEQIAEVRVHSTGAGQLHREADRCVPAPQIMAKQWR